MRKLNTRRQKRLILLIFCFQLVAIGLLSCTKQETEVSPTPLAQIVKVVQTATTEPTSMPTATAKPTETSSPTMQPTVTPSLTATATTTATATAITPSVTPTAETFQVVEDNILINGIPFGEFQNGQVVDQVLQLSLFDSTGVPLWGIFLFFDIYDVADTQGLNPLGYFEFLPGTYIGKEFNGNVDLNLCDALGFQGFKTGNYLLRLSVPIEPTEVTFTVTCNS